MIIAVSATLKRYRSPIFNPFTALIMLLSLVEKRDELSRKIKNNAIEFRRREKARQ